MTHTVPRILIVDGYPQSDRDNLAGCGMTTAGELYRAMFAGMLNEARFDIVYPSDTDTALPDGMGLDAYDGVAWTGCSLTIHNTADARVIRHIELARQAYRVGVPQYGTCWGIQIAAVAAGGVVAPNPGGREMGIARKITLNDAGRGHPMFFNKRSSFDGFVSHFDEVTHIPHGAVILAGNAFTRIQAMSVHHEKGTFWGLQYHPEYDLREMARLMYCRREALMKEGFFATEDDALNRVARFERLNATPEDKALAWELGVEDDILVDTVRQAEPRNWLDQMVLPRA